MSGSCIQQIHEKITDALIIPLRIKILDKHLQREVLRLKKVEQGVLEHLRCLIDLRDREAKGLLLQILLLHDIDSVDL